jgi:NhaP-type Na+/H+ or K+/H+ antiporter
MFSRTLLQDPMMFMELSRVVLGIQCFTAGIQTNSVFLRKHKQSLFVLLGPVLMFMFGSSAVIVHFIFQLGWKESLIVAACITPTDPVLANAIVKGAFADEHIPRSLRMLISIESGMNDGIGLPMLFLPFYLTAYQSYGDGFGYWISNVWLYQVGIAVVLGVLFGVVLRKLLKRGYDEGWMDKESLLALSVASALLFLGIFARLGLDDLLGCYITGLILAWDEWMNDQLEGSHIQEVLDSLINISYFIFFGTQIPWAEVGKVESLALWRILVGCILILLFRRLPAVLALWKWIPALNSWEEAFFCGFFGPIGVGGIGYALVSIVSFGEPIEPLFTIVSMIVVSSIFVHNGSVGLFHIGLTRARTFEQRETMMVVLPAPSNLTIQQSSDRISIEVDKK